MKTYHSIYIYNRHQQKQKTHVDTRWISKCVYSCIYKGPSGHPSVYIQKYIYPQANAAPRYNNGLTSLYTTKTNMYIIHHSGSLYRTTTCSSLRRRWWPTTTYPRRWWTTHRTLLPRRQASTRHSRQHCCSSHYGPP
jgi:hypothetical protein